MNEYKFFLIDNETKTEYIYGVAVGDEYEVKNNNFVLKVNKTSTALYKNIIKIKEIEKNKNDKAFEKIYNVYCYIPKKSDLTINIYCDICLQNTVHNVFMQSNNKIGHYACNKCNRTINSDIIVETLSIEKAKYTTPSNLLELINSKFDFKSEERYWLKAGDILKELNVQDQDITALQISIILRGNRIMPKSFLNKNYYPMPQLIGDDSFCNRYDKVE